MEAYDHAKSRCTKKNKRSGKTPKNYKCRCSLCLTHPSRHAFKCDTQRDLEREYLKSSGRYSGHERSAKEFVEWFYSPVDEEMEDSAGCEEGNWGTHSEELEREVGADVYREILKEHLLAQEQLERQRAAQKAEFEALAVAMEAQRVGELCLQSQRQDEEGSRSDEGDWDLLSTASSDESAYFDDWEEVMVEV